MDIQNDKKWFLYIGDHHEGPFSQGEIDQKFHSGQLNSKSFVWHQGMPDWKALDEVTELKVFPPIPQPLQIDQTHVQGIETLAEAIQSKPEEIKVVRRRIPVVGLAALIALTTIGVLYGISKIQIKIPIPRESQSAVKRLLLKVPY